MNLHGIASGIVASINPRIMCNVSISTGYSIARDGSQVPNYAVLQNVPVQVQPLSTSDIRRMGAINLQTTMRAIYISGNVEGINRSLMKGGDLFTFPPINGFLQPTVWLVVQVLEHWPDWTKLAVTLQNGS